jgi:hypothetical protein
MSCSPPGLTQVPSIPTEDVPRDRLDSWKDIAAYMRRDTKTVQRWEKREGMPVHRHLHDKMGSVYAFRSELDTWAQNRRLPTLAEDLPNTRRRRGPVSKRRDAARQWLSGGSVARRNTPGRPPQAAVAIGGGSSRNNLRIRARRITASA